MKKLLVVLATIATITLSAGCDMPTDNLMADLATAAWDNALIDFEKASYVKVCNYTGGMADVYVNGAGDRIVFSKMIPDSVSEWKKISAGSHQISVILDGTDRNTFFNSVQGKSYRVIVYSGYVMVREGS